VGKQPTLYVEDAENLHFTCKKDDVLPAALEKQKNAGITTGLKISKDISFPKIRKG